MAKAICINGHFYDDEKYQTCPHCAAGMKPAAPGVFAVVQETPQEKHEKEKTEEKRKLFGRAKDRWSREHRGRTQQGAGVTEDRTQILGVNAGGTGSAGHVSTGNTLPEAVYPPGNTGESKADSYRAFSTAPCADTEGGNSPGGTPQEDVTQELGKAYAGYAAKAYPGEAGSARPNGERSEERYPGRETPQEDMEGKTEKTESNAVGNARSVHRQDEGKTIGYFSAGIDREPPVGYLICIEGEDYGTGFPLKSGNNSMGRSASMDVVVMDPKVSREKQAYVMYEPRKREFFLKPGDSSGLCYLNDELLLEPKKLQAYDEIILGDTKLILIPVCGEKFSW